MTLSANIKLFADDSSLFIEVSNVETAHQTLMHDLETITAWANLWKMKFNPDISKQAIEVFFLVSIKKPGELTALYFLMKYRCT